MDALILPPALWLALPGKVTQTPPLPLHFLRCDGVGEGDAPAPFLGHLAGLF
jgi:hypothetical protein